MQTIYIENVYMSLKRFLQITIINPTKRLQFLDAIDSIMGNNNFRSFKHFCTKLQPSLMDYIVFL